MYLEHALPNLQLPSKAYALGEGRYALVLVKEVGKMNRDIYHRFQARAINADGSDRLDTSGFSIITVPNEKGTDLSGIATRQFTLEPGWVKFLGTVDPNALPEGWTRGEGKPASGNIGDKFWDDATNNGWTWSAGELETMRQGEADELLQMLVMAELMEAAP